MTPGRRIPQRRPMRRVLGMGAHIIEVLNARSYTIQLDSRVSMHGTAFFPGSRVLALGEAVTVTWREESRDYMITGVGPAPYTLIDLIPIVGADDGHWSEDETTFDATGATLSLNAVAAGADRDHLWVRFPAVPLAQAELVARAKVRFQKLALSDSPVSDIHMNDADDAAAPTTAADAGSKGLTAASTEWTFPGSLATDEFVDTPDFTAAVQEVLDRGGWATGQAMMVIIKAQTSGGGQTFDSVEASGENFAHLLIQIGNPVAVPTQLLNVGDLTDFNLEAHSDVRFV